MQILPVDTASRPVSSPSGERQALVFSPGQRFVAEVTAVFPEEKLLHLSVQGNPLRAHTTLRLSPGQAVELEVVSGGALPVLKSLPLKSADVVSVALKQALPVHLEPKDFCASLLKVLAQGVQSSSLPPYLLARAQALVSALPSLSSLTDPAGLAHAFAQSGLFWEAKLASPGKRMFQGDLKAELLRFLQAKKDVWFMPETGTSALEVGGGSVLDTLYNKAEGSVAKLLLDQLSALPQQDTDGKVWCLDLPFVHDGAAHSVRLGIELEDMARDPANQEQDSWSVTLELHPEELGAIHCRLITRAGNVSIQFCCEQSSTTALVGAHLGILQERFRQAGIVVGSVNVSTGIRPHSVLPLLSAPLVDELA